MRPLPSGFVVVRIRSVNNEFTGLDIKAYEINRKIIAYIKKNSVTTSNGVSLTLPD